MSAYRVVVGVDGSQSGRNALRWAVTAAAARNATVEAVMAYRFDAPDAVGDPVQQHRHATERLAAEIGSLPPGTAVPIATTVSEGMTADVLVQAARNADLLVIGSHGHSKAWQTAVGSVSESCIRHSPCPVVIMPAPRQPSSEGETP